MLSIGSDAKTVKGQKYSYLTGILYLAPHKTSGVANLCGNASPECIKTCLFTAGRGRYPNVYAARVRKTEMLKASPKDFFAKVHESLVTLRRRAAKRNMIPAARLDGTSDIGLAAKICEMFPDVQFYDYTKNPSRYEKFLAGKLPANWHLTFSRSEKNEYWTNRFLWEGGSVTILFDGKDLPETWAGWPVIDGDQTDLRFLDRDLFGLDQNTGFIVGLRAKGKAKKLAKGGFKV